MTKLPNDADDEIDLGQLLTTLWRGKLWIAAAAALGFAIGAFHIANTYPTFQADSLLQLESRPGGAMALPSGLAGMVNTPSRGETEIEILRSRMVLGRAIADQNLDWHVAPETMPIAGTMFSRYRFPVLDALLPSSVVRPDETIHLENLVVPPDFLNEAIELTVLSETEYMLTLPDDREVFGTVGQASTVPELGFFVTIAAIEAPAGRRFFITQLDETNAIRALRGSISVVERGSSWQGSGIIEIRLTGQDRAETVRALNAIIQAYVRQNISRSAAEAESSLVFIREQLPIAERNLRVAEEALNAFRREQVTIDLSLETQTILGQVTRLESELADLQRREDELAQRFTEAHPTYRQLLDERARLEARLESLRNQVGTLPETQRQILNLSREVELSQRIYTDLLTRAQEVEVLRASTIGSVRIIDTASALPSAIAPRKMQVLALATILGVLAGIAGVFLRARLRKGVKDASDIERLGLPVFATINYNRSADSQGSRKGDLPLIALSNPTDLTVEGLRSLRTSLHFGMLDARTPTLTLTSTHPGAGKSFLAANMAVIAAQGGQRVCLIDADLRRGQLRRYMGQARNHPGLAEVLSGQIQPQEAVVPGPVEDLGFIGTGRYPPNPSELMMRAELVQLIDWCAENFDLVLFDAPPVLAVTDPVILARNTASTILVARHEMTPPGEIESAIKMFDAAGVRFAGGILNGFDPSKAKHYGYSYGYRYAYEQRKD